MLAIPLKQTDAKTDIVKPVLKYIESGFGKEHADGHQEPLTRLQEMRNKARSVTDASGKAGRDLIFKYAQVLEVLDKRVPISETSVAIRFTWSDAFKKVPAPAALLPHCGAELPQTRILPRCLPCRSWHAPS